MVIQEYKQSWQDDFNMIRKVIAEALIDLHISIEHIGSTSVPGLAAKPVIDIDIALGPDVAFEEIKKRLEQIGYYHNGDQGIPKREVFKRDKTATHEVLDAIIHHLYVCPPDSEELQRHILFRDYLITNQEARALYQNLKYEIAKEADQNQKKYAELKELKARTFINNSIEKAKRDKDVTIAQRE